MNALGLPLSDVLDALRNANLDLPAGKIERGGYEVTLRAPAEFTDLDQISQHSAQQARRRPGDARTDRPGERHLREADPVIRINGERGLRVAIRKQAEATRSRSRSACWPRSTNSTGCSRRSASCR